MERESKNRIRKYILFLSLTLNAGMLFSQQNSLPQQWDLQTCIDYALANNIQVKQAVAGKESSKVDTNWHEQPYYLLYRHRSIRT